MREGGKREGGRRKKGTIVSESRCHHVKGAVERFTDFHVFFGANTSEMIVTILKLLHPTRTHKEKENYSVSNLQLSQMQNC